MPDLSLPILSLFLVLPLSLLAFFHLIIRPRPTTIQIKNRHVFVSGGSSGIGLAIAHLAARSGAKVSILARDVSKLHEAKQSIRLATGIDVAVLSADVRDYDALKSAVEEAGPIDVLVCNHGVFVASELDKQSPDKVKFMIDINLVGTFNLIKAALPGMKGRGKRGPGSIAIMSSQAGQVGIYGYTAYSASKFGLRGLAEALQQEVITDNIHVSLIFPPETDTPGFEIEKKQRPHLNGVIASSSSRMTAEEVAKKTLDGIKSGSFFVTCNFEGFLLSIATAGLSPERSSLMVVLEVILMGLTRIPGHCFLWSWYRSIDKWHAKNK